MTVSKLWLVAIAWINVFCGIGMINVADGSYFNYAFSAANFTIAVFIIMEYFCDKD